jgi:hypothetical protein
MGELDEGGFLTSSLYKRYEATSFKMNKNSSENYLWVFKIYSVTMKQFLENALPIRVYAAPNRGDHGLTNITSDQRRKTKRKKA